MRVMEAIYKGEDELGLKELLKREVQSGLVSCVRYPDDENFNFDKIHDYCFERRFIVYVFFYLNIYCLSYFGILLFIMQLFNA